MLGRSWERRVWAEQCRESLLLDVFDGFATMTFVEIADGFCATTEDGEERMAVVKPHAALFSRVKQQQHSSKLTFSWP